MANARKLAAAALVRMEKQSAYSNLTVTGMLGGAELSPTDKAFVSALIYGVLDRKLTLQYVLSAHMKTPFCKVSPYTAAVLQSALYQILYMDKVPASAAVNEAVKLVKCSKESRNAAFVNAVLRSILREGAALPTDDSVFSLSVRYSCPQDVIQSFLADYGLENTKAILEESLRPAPITLRVNTLKTTAEELASAFAQRGIGTEPGGIENALSLTQGIDIAADPFYRDGLFHVQDTSSQTAVSVLAPQPGERVLDLCAAPGGKSFTMAQWMQNKGELWACDLYENRIRLIEDGAKRLDLSIIKTAVNDAALYHDEWPSFDRVLCDVPCSGLGVLRRKPEIKYKPLSDSAALPEIQYAILQNAAKYLRPGGKLLYSTCTLRRAENEETAARFSNEHPVFRKMYEHTFLPHMDKTDGFYCALFQKEG